MLFVRAFSVTISTTRASCHVSRRRTVALSMGHRSCDSRSPPRTRASLRGAARSRAATSQRAAVVLLARALPEVQVRDEQTRRPAVLGVEWLVVELVRHPGLATANVL